MFLNCAAANKNVLCSRNQNIANNKSKWYAVCVCIMFHMIRSLITILIICWANYEIEKSE